MSKHAESLAQKKGGKGPSPADIMKECDKNESEGISKTEAIACIKKHTPKDKQGEVEAAVNHYFPLLDTDKSGEVSIGELEAAMNHKQSSLAQKELSPEQIFAACDKDGSQGLTKKEILVCIKEHVPEEHQEEAAK